MNARWLRLAYLSPGAMALAWWISKAGYFWSHRPELQFGWLVLLLSGWLVAETAAKQRPVLRVTRLMLGLAGPGLLLLLIGEMYQAAFGMSAASLFGFTLGALLVIFGNIGYLFGWPGLRRFLFPVGFLLFAVPFPSVFYDPLVTVLQQRLAWANVELLHLSGIAARQAGSLIELPRGTIGVSEACSGLRSLQGSVMSALFLGQILFSSIRFRAVLLGVGLGAALGGNLVRSYYLSWVASSGDSSAVEQVHDAAGWSIWLATLLALLSAAWVLRKVADRPRLPSEIVSSRTS